MQRAISAAMWICATLLSASNSNTQALDRSKANPVSPVSGYLAPKDVPSSASLVPIPPAAGSADMARDEEINRSALSMHDTPRWELAINDSVLTFPTVAQTFSCTLNVQVDEQTTPKLIHLLRRTLVDAGRATGEAKLLYKRARPFISNGKPVCTPEREAGLRTDGSYPSGHASVGWAFGLVLSEVSPEQENALLARGRAFGQSRLVCNVHWQSDVQEGQMVASAVVARLNAEPAFREDVAAARAEVEALRAKGAKPQRDCAAEARAINSWN